MVTRSGLPQNYIKSAGTVLDDFTTPADFAPSAGGSVAADPVHKKSASSIAFTPASGTGTSFTKTVSWDLSNMSFIDFWIYCANPGDIQSLSLYLAYASWTKYWNYSIPPTSLHTGWTLYRCYRPNWSTSNSAVFTSTITAFRVLTTPKADKVTTLTFDRAVMNQEEMPSVVITFDDPRLDPYTKAFSYMQPKGIRGTWFINGGHVGLGGEYCTLAQVKEMYADGWAIANHTLTHPYLNTLTYAEQYAEINGGRQWLIDNDMPRAADYFAYPYGAWDSSNQDSYDILDLIGTKVARMGEYGENQYPYDISYQLPLYQSCYSSFLNLVCGPSTTESSMRAVPSMIISRPRTYWILIHEIKDSPSLSGEMSTAAFHALIDALADSPIRCLTVDEWYNGLTNPRYRSLPLTRA